MENNTPNPGTLRLELLTFRKGLEQLQRKREEFWRIKLELETLEEVIHRDTIDLLDRLEEMGWLEPRTLCTADRTVLFIPATYQ